jgi:hypothetical protein
MSKMVRKQLLQAAEVLEQGTKQIGRLAADRRAEDCIALLTDCQDLAIALGTRIEKLRGVGTQTVLALEDYCEKLYLAGEAMQQSKGGASPFSVARRKLEDSLRAVRTAFEQDFPDKKEVVFLPYKASMWDSLESVWMAARDDADCEAYVIPIPYYTLDEQRRFREFHYEGDQYPDYVPVTDYRTYDLALHHPDAIYVHNPYDEFNNVTSVAPEFYLKKIKDYTEKLVYIPYFVLAEIDPSNQDAIDKMHQFCYLPGTWYADRVILQSEDMRQIYINEYIKAGEKNGFVMNRAEIEEKFLGLGSPKFDRAIRAKSAVQDIPEEWLGILQKPDGTRKKVIFYNTSVNALLHTGDKMLKKMRAVFQTFREYRDDVALLWRPHPLMKDTISAMLPDLWEEYQTIVQEYRDAGWGIYDDTPDLDRAIAISDAYYGDGSSVVQLCQKAGMPVMIQNVEVV